MGESYAGHGVGGKSDWGGWEEWLEGWFVNKEFSLISSRSLIASLRVKMMQLNQIYKL